MSAESSGLRMKPIVTPCRGVFFCGRGTTQWRASLQPVSKRVQRGFESLTPTGTQRIPFCTLERQLFPGGERRAGLEQTQAMVRVVDLHDTALEKIDADEANPARDGTQSSSAMLKSTRERDGRRGPRLGPQPGWDRGDTRRLRSRRRCTLCAAPSRSFNCRAVRRLRTDTPAPESTSRFSGWALPGRRASTQINPSLKRNGISATGAAVAATLSKSKDAKARVMDQRRRTARDFSDAAK